MFVTTYFELYTTMIGWKLYELVYVVCAQLGLTLFPFLAFIGKELASGSSDNDDSHGSSEVNVAISLTVLIIVFIIAVIPLSPVQPSTIKFQPLPTFENIAPPEVNLSNDPTTYKTSFNSLDFGNAHAPIWWSVAMNVSSGISQSITGALPKNPNINTFKVALSSESIKDPRTRAQYKDFFAKCYYPAKEKYNRLSSEKALPAQAMAAESKYGLDDLNWPGSRILQETPGMYLTCNTPVSCKSTLDSRQPIAAGGFPVSCGVWWNTLKQSILAEDAAKNSTWDSVRAFFGTSQAEIEDIRIKNLIKNVNRESFTGNEDYGNRGLISKAIDDAQGLLTIPAVFIDAVKQDSEIDLYKSAVPMVKACLIMMFLFFLPFLMIFSNYTVQGLITLTIVLFSFIFLHALWGVAVWVDSVMADAFAQGFGVSDYFTNPIDVGRGRIIIDVVSGALYLATPLLWVYMVSITGAISGHALAGSIGALGGHGVGRLSGSGSRLMNPIPKSKGGNKGGNNNGGNKGGNNNGGKK